MSVRKDRLSALARRRQRIRRLAGSARRTGAKIFLSGVVPAVLFDSPIYGLFGRPLRNFRNETGIVCGITGRKRDPDMAWALNAKKDPEITAASSVVFRFCSEVWNASLGTAFRDPAGTTLGTLASGVSVYLQSNPSPPKHVHGPISALHKSLIKGGWSFSTPLQLRDRQGADYHLLTVCPKRVASAFKADLQFMIRERYLLKIHDKFGNDESSQLLQKSIFYEPLQSTYNKLNFRQAQTLLLLTSNGAFTNL